VQLSSSAERGDSPSTLEVVETEPGAASVCGVAAAVAAASLSVEGLHKALTAGLAAGAIVVAVVVKVAAVGPVLAAVLQLCTLVPVAAAGTGDALCFLGEACRGERLAAAAAAAAAVDDDEAICTERALPAAAAVAVAAGLSLALGEVGAGSFVVSVLTAVAMRDRVSSDGVLLLLLTSASSTTTISGVRLLALLLLLLLPQLLGACAAAAAAGDRGLLDVCCGGFSEGTAFLGFEADAGTAELGLLFAAGAF
jgi:hypothetical protein